jgi:hypothetical protein
VTTITCKVPKKLAAKLESIARKERRPEAAVLREALELRLKGAEPHRKVAAYDLVRHLAGKLHGAPADLATNPEHLRGFGE